jgi:carboxypeptidase family protein
METVKQMNRKLRVFLVLLATVLVFVSCIPSLGQVLKGSISGAVEDPQGAVISGAKVKATNSATGVVLTTTTDGSGLFRFNLIQAGEYKVEVSAQGFKTALQKDISVVAGRDSGLGTIRLALGETSSTVEVSSESPLVETSQAQVTNTFSGATLARLAGVQENQGLDNLALLVPGVVSTRDQGFSNTNGGGGFSVNGVRGRNNDQEIDGQNNNDNSVGGPALAYSDPEFVAQYVLISNNFGPEYGRNAGSVVNLITKSGSNAWHGSIYANENNSILNSLTSTQKSLDLKQPPRANDEFGGGTAGGPIVKNKAFFFGGLSQEIVSSSTAYTTGAFTPTPAGLATLAGCFPTGASAIAVSALGRFGPYGISAGNPKPGNVKTTNIVDPITNAVTCPNVQVGTVSRLLPTPIHNFNWVTKEDLHFGASDTLTARYIFTRSNAFNLNDNAAAGYVFNVPALSQAVLLSETHNFGTRMVNEARVGFDRLNVEFGGNSIGTEPSTSNILSALTAVLFLDPGALGYGVNPGLPQGRVVNTWQAQDNWNYLLGRHTLKAGVNWTYQQSPNIFLPFINGGYLFPDLSSYVMNQPLVDIITAGNPELGLKEYDTFLYIGDDWRARSNLTINLGITYSYYGQPLNQLHDLGVKQQQGPNPLWDKTLPLSVTAPSLVSSFKKGIGPSIGFAYQPQWGGFLTGGKTTVRGGYRMAYDPSFYNILLNNYGGPPSVLQAILPGTLIGGPAATQLPAVPTGPNVRAALLPLISSLGPLDPRDLGEVTVAPDFRPDQVQSWSLGIERQLSKNAALEVRYVGNHGSQLFQTVNANPFIADLAAQFPKLVPAGDTPCPAAKAFSPSAIGRVNCNQGILLSRNNSGYSNYHAIQTEFRANNLFNQMTVRASYTHSKTLDNVSEIFSSNGAGTTVSISQNPLDPGKGEYSFSGLDIPNTFTALVQEEIPFFKSQKGLLGHIIGGWLISGSYVWESGQPFTPVNIALPATGAGDFFDSGFLNQFNGGLFPARPFLGNLSAPADSVGIFAGDACTALGQGCAAPASQLISLNALNSAKPSVVNVTKDNVRYIANTGIAQSTFGTPFGNAPRNIGRDAPLNYLNASVTKTLKFTERSWFEFRFSVLNAFNHANFASVTPFVESAGTGTFGNAFALPQFTGTSIPGSNLAANRRLYVGGTFRF